MGQALPFTQDDVRLSGHSIECRINAENPSAGFLPCPGTVHEWVPPQGQGIRVDTFVQPGSVISPYYDSMVAKLIVYAEDRAQALKLMSRALSRLRIGGVETTTPLHLAVMADEEFATTPITTRWLEESFLPRWEGSLS